MTNSNFMERLGEKIRAYQNPSLLGLDPRLDYLPPSLLAPLKEATNQADLAAAIEEALLAYNTRLLEATKDIIPAVKFQMAYYEQYGIGGLKALQRSIDVANEHDFLVVMDGKRNDIGATAGAYAKAFLSQAETPFGQPVRAFQGDCLTVNCYLGSDGIKPFADVLREEGKGIFVLLRTSNKSGGELQDLVLNDNRQMYRSVAERIGGWAEELRAEGEQYSPMGIVVGATWPKEARRLRQNFPHLFFLVPGYGAQGATAEDVAAAFDSKGGGAIINSSRGLMNAYQKRGMDHEDFAEATRLAALDMKEEFLPFLKG